MKSKKQLSRVVIKFAGDSGDGMQLSGSQFSNTTAFVGNELATFPDFPAEIRAPQGTLFGVSGFKIHFGDTQITSPGDYADVLIAMNPAALKLNLSQVNPNAIIIVNEDSFTKKNLQKAEYQTNPLEDNSLSEFRVVKAPITKLNIEAIKDFDIPNKDRNRSKNMFALGVVYWLFNRPLNVTIDFLNDKFKNNSIIAKANEKTLRAGYNFANTLELFNASYYVKEANLPKGRYRTITGNQAIAWGIIAAKENSRLNLFFGSYPITPASDILHELSKHKNQEILIFQAEDEIAGISSAIGAAFAGSLAVTTTSGPGMALKTEAIGLAVMAELPLVIINVQRGGPSTGLPTKTEQSDFNQAVYGRNGESPLVVMAAVSPEDCFDKSYIAAKIALEYMGPVILLSDGYIANGSTPWKIKTIEQMPDIAVKFSKNQDYQPYLRDINQSRFWATPGMKNKAHRLGGLEKEAITGNVSYDPENHSNMIDLRAKKVQLVQESIPNQEVYGKSEGKLLVVGWGGTYGDLYNAVKSVLSKSDDSIALTQFSYLYPMPKNVKDIFSSYKTILVCELNSGQFVNYLRSIFVGTKFSQFNKIKGIPFSEEELVSKFYNYLKL